MAGGLVRPREYLTAPCLDLLFLHTQQRMTPIMMMTITTAKMAVTAAPAMAAEFTVLPLLEPVLFVITGKGFVEVEENS